MPALRFLTTNDDEERLVLLALANRAVQLDAIRQRNLAAEIVNALSKSLRRG